MIKDRNCINTSVPTQKIEDFEKFLKKRKSFEDINLVEIKNISCVGNKRVTPTNYKYVFIIKKGNLFTYLASIRKKVSKRNSLNLKWCCSFSNVLVAAKAVDRKLLEYGFKPVNFNFKLKQKEEKIKKISA